MTATLSTVHSGLFTSNALSGNGAAITNLTRASISAGTPNQVLVNDGSGLISGVSALNAARGGTGVDSSAVTGVSKVSGGTWSWSTIVDADVSGAAAITRSKLASGTAGHVVVNDVSGALSSEAQLSVARGGTGINTALSSGVAKVSTGTWSVSAVVDTDVSASAAIARSKLANGLANHVIINTAGGVMGSEAQLSVARGGTGQDFSASGAGPFVTQVASGLFSLVAATPNATASTYVTRNGSGATAVNALTTSSVTSAAGLSVAPIGDLTLDPGGVINTADSVVEAVPAGFPNGKVARYAINLDVTGAPFVPFWTLLTVNNTAYTVSVVMTGKDSANAATVSFSFTYRARNIGGTVTKYTDQAVISSYDVLLDGAAARGYSTVTSIGVEVSAVAARTVRWCGYITCVQQG